MIIIVLHVPSHLVISESLASFGVIATLTAALASSRRQQWYRPWVIAAIGFAGFALADAVILGEVAGMAGWSAVIVLATLGFVRSLWRRRRFD